MRYRQRSPILNLLQLAIFGFIFWQVSRAMSADPGESPGAMFDTTFGTMRLIFLGVVASIALNILYPLAVWGIGRLRDRQASPGPRFAVAKSAEREPERQSRHCPGCGALLFDDAPACPWCGHQLAATPD